MLPVEVPAVTLLVLDGLADDIESFGSLVDHGTAEPYGLVLVEEWKVVDALRELVRAGLVAVWDVVEPRFELVPVATPTTDDGSLRRYRFRRTPAGESAWHDGRSKLDAYWDAEAPE